MTVVSLDMAYRFFRGGSGRLDTRLDTPPSAFSEVSEPEEVILVLREYHTALGILVDKFEGTVERFTGDGLLVIFKDPLPCPDPSIRAVQMAVEMRDEVTKLSVKWSRFGHDIGFGIGIAHGYATLGTVGYEGQFQYSVTGKVANLASRLCNEAKNGQILIDINVFSAVETRVDAEFTEELILKGFSRPVKAFNVRNWLRRRKGEPQLGLDPLDSFLGQRRQLRIGGDPPMARYSEDAQRVASRQRRCNAEC
jgi:class 3 adenylate cyclase